MNGVKILSRPAGATVRAALRWALATLYAIAGYFHLAEPQSFLRIMPGWVPAPEAVVFWTGVAELAAAPALAQTFSRSLRRAAGAALALYALCVWPANANHMLIDLARPDGGWGMGYHLPRMLAQPLVIWAALWAGGATDWPFARRTRP